MAMMGDRLEMDDNFMRLISRCCQCGNESGKPDRLKFLPCSHLMCIRCLEGVRTGTNTTARTPRTARENDAMMNGESTHRSSEEIFLTEVQVGELPEGKREMYTKAFCPACDQSFLVPNSTLSIFEDDFHNIPLLARFITGHKHPCQRCIEIKEAEAAAAEVAAAEAEKEAEAEKKKGHKCDDDTKRAPAKPANKQPQKKDSNGVKTSPQGKKAESPPAKKADSPPAKKGSDNAAKGSDNAKGPGTAKGPAKKGGKAPVGGAKKKGAATPRGKGAAAKDVKGKEAKPASPEPEPEPEPETTTEPEPEATTEPEPEATTEPEPEAETEPEKAQTPPKSQTPEDAPATGSEKEESLVSEGGDQATSRKVSEATEGQQSDTSTVQNTGEMSDLSLDLDATPAEFFCMGCNKFLCSSCSHEHLTPENLKEHRLVPAHEYIIDMQEEMVTCLRHPQKRYTHFCLNEKCQRAICAVCLNQIHHEHRVEPIAKVTRDASVMREVLNNSKAIEMKVRLRMRELQESKVQDDVIAALNEEIERLKEGYITLLDNYKNGINARFNEINGKFEIEETRVRSYLEKIKTMNSVLNNVVSRPDYVDQDLLVLAHFLGSNQDILTNERKVEDLMRQKTPVVHHYGLDFGELQSIFKSSKELPQTIPFDLHKTARQDFPLPKELKLTCSNKLMVASSVSHTFDVFLNNDVVFLDPKGKSIHKYQCVNAGGLKQLRFQYMYHNGAKEKNETLVCPAGIAVYEGYTLVCDTTPSVKGAPKRGQVLVFDDKLNPIDAIPLDAIPHCMVSYQDQIYIGFKTKVVHYQIYIEEKYNGETEFHLEHAENYYVGTEWWSYLAVNREGHLAIQDGNSEIYIFKDGQQALKPSTKIRGARGITFFGVNKLVLANWDKNNITAYSLKDDVNDHPIIDRELPVVLLTAKDKVTHPLMVKADYDGDLIVTDDKGQVKLYVSPNY